MSGKKISIIAFPFLVLISLYFLGPSVESATYHSELPTVPTSMDSLAEFVAQNEQRHRLKPDNEARIVWADSTKQMTEVSIVYLHGFSASQKEGDPVHRRLASEFGYNLYLARIADHGVDTTESLLYFTAERAWNSAKEALAIGNRLGKKTIIVSTSTGGTLALKLAATYPDRVHALINLSPNIAINNPAAFLLNDPWGLQISRMVMNGKYRITGASGERAKYWNNKYRLESVVQLEELVESNMTDETFEKVTQPTLTLYYYKNDKEQDPEVKVSAMLEMHEKLGTPDSLKFIKAIPGAGAHVLGSDLVSNDVTTVFAEMKSFVAKQFDSH